MKKNSDSLGNRIGDDLSAWLAGEPSEVYGYESDDGQPTFQGVITPEDYEATLIEFEGPVASEEVTDAVAKKLDREMRERTT